MNEIEKTHPLEELPETVRNLRSRELKKFGESRQCALFCFGIGEALGFEVSYTQYEASDYDFVATYLLDNEVNYVPIQMKEFVPEKLNSKAELENEIAKLSKYVDSSDLCVAIYLNRAESIDFQKLDIPKLNIKELWLFGAMSADLDQWLLAGNMLGEPRIYEFRYPRA